jgi:nucleoid-associated protein YgaU
MATRYDGILQRNTTIRNAGSLKEVLDSRSANFIKHYNVSKLKYPTLEQIENMTVIKHIWKYDDRYWKLSERYYGDPKYWWIIAWFNKKPIEASLGIGEYVLIPQPLSYILDIL